MKKTKKQLDAEVKAALTWGPVTTPDSPPSAGAASVIIDGRSYSVIPAAIRTARSTYEHEFARAVKHTKDDAWLVAGPNGSVIGCIVGTGRHWSIYRRSDGAPWSRDQEAEISYRRGHEGDWRSAVVGMANLSI